MNLRSIQNIKFEDISIDSVVHTLSNLILPVQVPSEILTRITRNSSEKWFDHLWCDEQDCEQKKRTTGNPPQTILNLHRWCRYDLSSHSPFHRWSQLQRLSTSTEPTPHHPQHFLKEKWKALTKIRMRWSELHEKEGSRAEGRNLSKLRM